MARTRVVTRSIKVTEIKALCMDLVNQTAVSQTFYLTGDSYEQDKALKTLQKSKNNETLAVVAIQTMDEHEEIYGMLEEEFLKVAKRMTEDRKFVEDDVEE